MALQIYNAGLIKLLICHGNILYGKLEASRSEYAATTCLQVHMVMKAESDKSQFIYMIIKNDITKKGMCSSANDQNFLAHLQKLVLTYTLQWYVSRIISRVMISRQYDDVT